MSCSREAGSSVEAKDDLMAELGDIGPPRVSLLPLLAFGHVFQKGYLEHLMPGGLIPDQLGP